MEQRAHFSSKLDELKMLVLRMAAMSEKAVHRSMQSFFELDGELAEEIINQDCDINNLEDVDTKVLEQLIKASVKYMKTRSA